MQACKRSEKLSLLVRCPKAMSQFVPVAADVIVDEKESGGPPSTPSLKRLVAFIGLTPALGTSSIY